MGVWCGGNEVGRGVCWGFLGVKVKMWDLAILLSGAMRLGLWLAPDGVLSLPILCFAFAVVQFYYGEDGLDVTQVSYLSSYDFIARNAAAAALKVGLEPSSNSSSSNKSSLEQAVTTALRERARLLKKARKGDLQAQQQLKEQLPIMARFFPSILGATSEAFGDKLWDYCSENKGKLLWEGEEGGSGKKRKKDKEHQQQQGGAPPGAVAVEGKQVGQKLFDCREYACNPSYV